MNFEQLFSHVPDSMVVLSPDYRILAATDHYLAVTMSRREDILGKRFLLEVFPEKDTPYEQNPVKLALDKVVETRQPVPLSVRYDLEKPRSEGGGFETRYWDAIHTPVYNPAGELEYIIQVTHDVTERELAKQAQAASEERFRNLTDVVPELIHISDPAGNATYFNLRWLSYTGLAAEELKQQQWHKAVHPSDLPNLEKIKNLNTDDSGTQFELRLRDAAGNFRWHLMRSLPVKNEKGELQYYISATSDIHQTKLMVEELLETNEQMSALSDQVQQAYAKAEAERKTLQTLFQKAPAFFCTLTGPEHRFDLINEKYQALFPGRALKNRPVAEALPEVKEQGFVDVLDRVYRTGQEFIAEDIAVKLARHEGAPLEDRYLTFIYQPLYSESDSEITGILVFGYETTEYLNVRNKANPELESNV